MKVLMRCLQHFRRDTIMNQKCILELREARNINARRLYMVNQVKGKPLVFFQLTSEKTEGTSPLFFEEEIKR